MKIGVGYCNNKDGLESGRTTAKLAVEQGNIENPKLVISFCSEHIDPNEFFKGISEITGNEVPIIGGAAIGVITNEHIDNNGYSCTTVIIDSKDLKLNIANVDELDKGENEAGKLLTQRFPPGIDKKLMLLFYDSIKKPPSENTPPLLNASPKLLKGIEEELKSNITIIGAGLIKNHAFQPAAIFTGSSIKYQSAVGALLSGGFDYYFCITHGCTPLDGIYHKITKIKEQFVFEIDGRPAIEVIDEIYGNTQWRKDLPVQLITIGQNYGDPYGEFSESNYVNRLIAGTLPNNEGIVLFEPDLHEGTEFQFMLRDGRKMIESAKLQCEKIMDSIEKDNKTPLLGLYIDCAGRAANFSNTLTEEAAEIQKVFNKTSTPLLGLYSGVEIAPFQNKNKGLDWTGVLLVFTTE